jgi:hypothetical protein
VKRSESDLHFSAVFAEITVYPLHLLPLLSQHEPDLTIYGYLMTICMYQCVSEVRSRATLPQCIDVGDDSYDVSLALKVASLKSSVEEITGLRLPACFSTLGRNFVKRMPLSAGSCWRLMQ